MFCNCKNPAPEDDLELEENVAPVAAPEESQALTDPNQDSHEIDFPFEHPDPPEPSPPPAVNTLASIRGFLIYLIVDPFAFFSLVMLIFFFAVFIRLAVQDIMQQFRPSNNGTDVVNATDSWTNVTGINEE